MGYRSQVSNSDGVLIDCMFQYCQNVETESCLSLSIRPLSPGGVEHTNLDRITVSVLVVYCTPVHVAGLL